MRDHISHILKGIAMGIAEAIPGVSGGTIAFITGIYERLLSAVKNFDISAVKMLIRGDFKSFWKRIDGIFMIALLMGMASGLIAGVFAVTYLIEYHIEPLLGFFFGLILASVWFVGRQVEKWNINKVLVLGLGIFVALFIVVLHPMQGSREYWYVYLSASIAICAMVLPGISGSFILLLLGMYTIIIPEVKVFLTTFSPDSFKLLIVFGSGLLTGLLLFVRVMNWAFKRYRQSTLALLTGFMAGSLYRIWPWRMPVEWINKETGEKLIGIEHFSSVPVDQIIILSDRLVFPQHYEIGNPATLSVILSIMAGVGIVIILGRNQKQTINNEK